MAVGRQTVWKSIGSQCPEQAKYMRFMCGVINRDNDNNPAFSVCVKTIREYCVDERSLTAAD